MYLMTVCRLACAVAVVMTAAAHGAAAQEKVTEHTIKLSAGARSPAATIADMAWLAGHWTGEGLGGTFDEVWTPPAGGMMLGMFRLMKDGKPSFYELLTMSEHEGSLIIRLKHFHADMKGWEERDRTVDFPFVSRSGETVHFSGLTFHRDDENRVTVYLAIGDKTGKPREEMFRWRRVGR